MGKTISTFGIKHSMVWPAVLVNFLFNSNNDNTGLIFIFLLVEQKAQ